MNDIQWDILIENQRRNLENPEIEECLKHAKDGIGEDLRQYLQYAYHLHGK